MARFGYTMMCEQRSPRHLVADARVAEAAGFDFLAISDHFHPWLESQGQSPFTWSVLGAVAEATRDVSLMTMVTCPTMRYHPVLVAQMAATVALLSDGRFELGLGAGENLNEHVVGRGWPSATTRHEMLAEALDIIRRLWTGGYHSYDGDYFTVEDARIFSLPERPVRVHMAAGGPEAARLAGELADGLITSEPSPDLVSTFQAAGGDAKPRFNQIAVCYAASEDEALRTAHALWRFAVPGWKVMAELPNLVNFEAASTTVRSQDLAELVVCGPDAGRHVDGIKKVLDAGFDGIAVVQVGPDQEGFCRFWERELRPRLERLQAA
jgi:G6PDH family F420-dependent oxidoreductase